MSHLIGKSNIDSIIIKLKFKLARITHYGVIGSIKKLINKIIETCFTLILLPISIVMYFLGYCRIDFFINRIGHLAIEPDTFLKAVALDLIKKKKWIVLAPLHQSANHHLLKYWDQYFTVYRSTVSCFFFRCLTRLPFMKFNVSHFINNDQGSQYAYKINVLWGHRDAILKLTDDDHQYLQSFFSELGIPVHAWYVCVHVREGGFSPVDESLHSHRNGNIDNLMPAIQEIIRRGGWVIRLGDPTMKRLPAIEHVIDYAHHPMRNARLDIVLCAQARFILGNTSGMFLVGTLFGVPSALANMIPMPTFGFLSQDISIPKLLKNRKTGCILTLKETMLSPVSTYRYASMYYQHDMEVIENSPEEILELTKEMLDRLDGKFIEAEEDVASYRLFMSYMKKNHYGYGAAGKLSFTFLSQMREKNLI